MLRTESVEQRGASRVNLGMQPLCPLILLYMVINSIFIPEKSPFGCWSNPAHSKGNCTASWSRKVGHCVALVSGVFPFHFSRRFGGREGHQPNQRQVGEI